MIKKNSRFPDGFLPDWKTFAILGIPGPGQHRRFSLASGRILGWDTGLWPVMIGQLYGT